MEQSYAVKFYHKALFSRPTACWLPRSLAKDKELFVFEGLYAYKKNWC